MGSLKTTLSVRQIQLALRNSSLFDRRNDIIVPNVSWGLLPYEADLLAISKAGQVTEVEIKRSMADLRADFKKGHLHDSEDITYFYYCVPESLVEKAKETILSFFQARYAVPVGPEDCPALLCYTESGEIRGTGFGKARRFGYRSPAPADKQATAGRLASLRYWNLLEETVSPEDRGLQKRHRETQKELRTVKASLDSMKEEYRALRLFLRIEHPEVWKEFLDMDD